MGTGATLKTMRGPRGYRVVVSMIALLGAGIALGSGCRDATQVTLDIRMSDRAQCSEIRGTAITVGVEPIDTEKRVSDQYVTAATRACDESSRAIGTLVVTPGDPERASVVVVVAYDKSLGGAEACRPPMYKGCIVARRRFSFAKYRHLTMPITLDPECKDVPCEAFSTCRQGLCIDSTVDTSESGSGGGVVKEPGQTPDGGVDPGQSVDGSADGTIPDLDGGLDGTLTDGPLVPDGEAGVEGGTGTVPFCTADVTPQLRCTLSAGVPASCQPGQVCCGAAPSCTPACVLPDQRCCTSTDCGAGGCCERPDAGNGAGFCKPKSATVDGAVPFLQCADDVIK